jgi:hypothetical protein
VAENLDPIARKYVSKMTSIRGRRVHRLLMRELSRFDDVLPVTAEDGKPALLAVPEDGGACVCQTDGRGATATILEWARLDDATITIAYDLLKDSIFWQAPFVAASPSPARRERGTNVAPDGAYPYWVCSFSTARSTAPRSAVVQAARGSSSRFRLGD